MNDPTDIITVELYIKDLLLTDAECEALYPAVDCPFRFTDVSSKTLIISASTELFEHYQSQDSFTVVDTED